jgi:hypothetical protein
MQKVVKAGHGEILLKIDTDFSPNENVLHVDFKEPSFGTNRWRVERAWWSSSSRGMNLNVEVRFNGYFLNKIYPAPGIFKVIPMHSEFATEIDLPTLYWGTDI